LEPVIPAAIKLVSTLEHTNPAFNTSVPPTTSLKPALLFMMLTSLTLSPRLGQDHPFDASLLSNLFIL
jgi:hypothetical protein